MCTHSPTGKHLSSHEIPDETGNSLFTLRVQQTRERQLEDTITERELRWGANQDTAVSKGFLGNAVSWPRSEGACGGRRASKTRRVFQPGKPYRHSNTHNLRACASSAKWKVVKLEQNRERKETAQCKTQRNISERTWTGAICLMICDSPQNTMEIFTLLKLF